jgi:hypothetical protein
MHADPSAHQHRSGASVIDRVDNQACPALLALGPET